MFGLLRLLKQKPGRNMASSAGWIDGAEFVLLRNLRRFCESCGVLPRAGAFLADRSARIMRRTRRALLAAGARAALRYSVRHTGFKHLELRASPFPRVNLSAMTG